MIAAQSTIAEKIPGSSLTWNQANLHAKLSSSRNHETQVIHFSSQEKSVQSVACERWWRWWWWLSRGSRCSCEIQGRCSGREGRCSWWLEGEVGGPRVGRVGNESEKIQPLRLLQRGLWKGRPCGNNEWEKKGK